MTLSTRNMALMAWLLTALVTLAATPASGQRETRPERPERPAASFQLSDEQVRELRERYEQDRNPTVIVLMGIEDNNGQLRYDMRSILMDRVGAELREELRRVFAADGVRMGGAREFAEDGVLDSLRRDAGDAIAGDAARLMNERFAADLIVDVTFLVSDRGGYAVNMSVVDSARGVEIAGQALNAIAAEPDVRVARNYGQVLVREFGEEYLNMESLRNRATTYTLWLMGVDGAEGIDDRVIRQLRRDIDRNDLFEWAETQSETTEDGARFAAIDVRYRGDLSDLLLDIEDEVLPEHELAWDLQQYRGQIAVAYLFADRQPEWHRVTDPEAATFAPENEARLSSERFDGIPRLGVIVGTDLPEPMAAFEAQEPDAVRFADDTLRGVLEGQFRDLGFRVVDGATLRRQFRAQLNNAQGYDNLPHMTESLMALDGVDVVVHVNLGQSADGSPAMNVRMIDTRRGEVIGFQHWPDAGASRLARYRINPERPDEVARYLAGQLVSRWDRYNQSSASTLDVQVRNIQSAGEAFKLAQVLRMNLQGVRSVSDLQIATPAATFEVLYDGGPTDVIFGALPLIGEKFPGSEVQVLANTLIVNLRPEVSDDEMQRIVAEQPPAPAPGAQPEPGPGPQPGANPPANPGAGQQGERFDQILARVRPSVGVIGVRAQNQFIPMGTGWVVSEGYVATNSHVAAAVYEFLEQYRSESGQIPAVLEIVIKLGVDHEKEVTLGKAYLHQGYLEWTTHATEYVRAILERQNLPAASDDQMERMRHGFVHGFDVALFEVLEGDVGTPLQLAGTPELHGIDGLQPIFYAGFPMENLNIAPDRPLMSADNGNVVANTGFNLERGQPTDRYLIQYDLITAGGASGSPVFNERGHVIGLNSAGSYLGVMSEGATRPTRIRTGMAYAQRVDLLQPLLAGEGVELNRANYLELFPAPAE